MKQVESWITQHWYRKNKTWLADVLFPFAFIFSVIVRIRKCLYQKKIFQSYRASCPVIVVGNITLGGVGKTPFIIALYYLLKEKGWTPGIVSRGYKGNFSDIVWVSADADPKQVGDEAVLLATRTHANVVVSRNRVNAIKALIQKSSCNIILSDDGLQHYAMQRDIEIAVIDVARALGNQLCLPAGPLREPASRLKTVDMVVYNGGKETESSFFLSSCLLVNLLNSNTTEGIEILNTKTVHAVAGIGSPERFFQSLRALGANVIEHPYPDHYWFQAHDFQTFSSEDFVIMTEKDAVKCHAFAKSNFWFLSVEARLNDVCLKSFSDKMSKIITL